MGSFTAQAFSIANLSNSHASLALIFPGNVKPVHISPLEACGFSNDGFAHCLGERFLIRLPSCQLPGPQGSPLTISTQKHSAARYDLIRLLEVDGSRIGGLNITKAVRFIHNKGSDVLEALT